MSKAAEEYLNKDTNISNIKLKEDKPMLYYNIVKAMQEFADQQHQSRVNAISDEINKTWIDEKGKTRGFLDEHKKRIEQLLKQ